MFDIMSFFETSSDFSAISRAFAVTSLLDIGETFSFITGALRTSTAIKYENFELPALSSESINLSDTFFANSGFAKNSPSPVISTSKS